MTRRVSKTGRTYTAGSHATRGSYPPICAGCGKKVVVTGLEPLWFETIGGVQRSWHVRCRSGNTKGAAA